VHTTAIFSAAPGTSRPTRRAAETSWVTVSWAATAPARIVESTARRRRPVRIPVCSITFLTASLTRCGRADFAIRFRQYTSVEGSNPLSSSDTPMATFHRTSNRTASAASRPEKPCSACSVITAAICVAGTDGRPRPGGANRSA
jgi:hypothetical protein